MALIGGEHGLGWGRWNRET